MLFRIWRGWVNGMIVSLPFILAACANAYPPELVPVVASRPDLYQPYVEPDYMIQTGDSLLVNSYFDQSLKQPVVVLPDGKVSLLLVGTVVAAGKTPKRLADELRKDYRRYLDDRDLTITVTESAGQSVYVGGEVKSPSVLPLRGDMTVLQAVTAAGGFLPSANQRQVLILRPNAAGRFQTVQTDVEASLRNEGGQLYLRRHDVIYAPKTAIAKADQFVDQYINQIVPRSVNATFGYQFFNQVGNTSVTAVPAR